MKKRLTHKDNEPEKRDKAREQDNNSYKRVAHYCIFIIQETSVQDMNFDNRTD